MTDPDKDVETAKKLLVWFEEQGYKVEDTVEVMAIAVSAVLKTIARDAFEPREEFLKGVELVANMIRDREGEELQ